MHNFAAQNRSSRNPHQNPVKSHKGGYLRCPFNISAGYAELAEKRVREDLARGGAGARGAAAVADKDGLLSSSLSSGRQVGVDDGTDGNGGRPWSRAGVGASKLSGKEKRTQQEQAELIYGRGSFSNGDGDDATAGTISALGRGPSQEHMFAVDSRDQAALQQVVPRAVREKVKRRKLEEGKQSRMQLVQHTPHRQTGSGADAREAKREGEHRSTVHHTDGNREGSTRMSAGSSNGGSGNAAASQSSSTRQAPATPPAGKLQREDGKPKNKMQMLDDLRSSALMGKKRMR
jgi:hypothetical protein